MIRPQLTRLRQARPLRPLPGRPLPGRALPGRALPGRALPGRARAVIVTLAVLASLAGLTAAAGAADAATGATFYSHELAGYSVVGGHIRYAQGQVKLPGASTFSAITPRMGYTIHLVSGARTVVLGISRPTTPGPWNAAIAVFDNTRAGHPLLHSDEHSAPMAVGDNVTLSIYYDRGRGDLRFLARDSTTGAAWRSTYHSPGALFYAARFGTAYAATPWDTAQWAQPSTPTRMSTFHRIAVTSYNGTRGALTGIPWTTLHHYNMTSAAARLYAYSPFPWSDGLYANGAVRRNDAFGVWATSDTAEPTISGVRVASGQPIRAGWLMLPAGPGSVTFAVSTARAERVQLFLVPTGTGTQSSARLIGEGPTVNGLFAFTWHYPDQTLSAHLEVVAIGPGGQAVLLPFNISHP